MVTIDDIMRFVPPRRHSLSKFRLLPLPWRKQYIASDTPESLQNMDQETTSREHGGDGEVEPHTPSHG